MIIGITGATGFIGKTLIQTLLCDSSFELRVFLRKGSRKESLNFCYQEKRVEFREVDYFDLELMKQVFSDLDFIVHLAGVTKSKNYEDFYTYNTEITRNIVKALAANSGKPYLVFTSSQSAMGASENFGKPIGNNDEFHPVSHYGKSKLKAEKIIREDYENFTILRFPSIFGPYDLDGLSIFRMAKIGIVLSIGKEDDYIDCIYSEEISHIIHHVLGNSEIYLGKTFNIGYEKPLHMRKMIRAIREQLGKKPGFLYLKLPPFLAFMIGRTLDFLQVVFHTISIINYEKIKELSQKYWIFDTTEFRKNTGYRFSSSYETMIKNTVQWYKDKNFL